MAGPFDLICLVVASWREGEWKEHVVVLVAVSAFAVSIPFVIEKRMPSRDGIVVTPAFDMNQESGD